MPTINVRNGAWLQCTQGTSPAQMKIAPPGRLANIQDFTPIANIPAFSLCRCPANPHVAAATAAHMGVLTMAPCVPAPTAVWNSTAPPEGPGKLPLIEVNSTLICAWGGVITITKPGP